MIPPFRYRDRRTTPLPGIPLYLQAPFSDIMFGLDVFTLPPKVVEK